MVKINFTVPGADWLIPADLKRTTIRKVSPKMDLIKRKDLVHLYWGGYRDKEQRLLCVRRVRSVRIIDMPILDFIGNAPPEVIYMEGFGFDYNAMSRFFIERYPDLLDTCGAFYIVEWYPERNTLPVMEGSDV